MRSLNEIHGTLVVDKPLGPTSHDVVAQARKVYGTRRVGHTGTLDPMATGVLVLLFGEATKLSAILSAADKQYTARVVFGYSTDTDDAFGNPKRTADELPDLVNSQRLEEALDTERKRVWQVPPNVSAIKRDGEPAYRTVRRGLDPTPEPRAVNLYRLCVRDAGSNYLDLDLHCGKGYYVRALARDLGESMGCPAHLGELRRVRNGPFAIESAAKWPPVGDVPSLRSIVDTVQHVMPTAQLSETGAKRARCGQVLTSADFIDLPSLSNETRSIAWIFGEQLIAVGEHCDDNTFRVTRGFACDR
jgi:tRNA pseudouridine55 synthase